MLDEFEIRLASKKTRMFSGDSLAKDRRDAEHAIWRMNGTIRIHTNELKKN